MIVVDANIIAYWAIGLPVGYIFMETLGYGVDGMWYGLSIGLMFSALFLTVRFERRTRHKRASAIFKIPEVAKEPATLTKDISASNN